MKEQHKRWLVRAGWLLFYLYILLLCYFLFFSEHYGRDYMTEGYRYNLEFFKEIKRFIRYREQLGMETFIVNILGNILAFAPFGFLLPLLNRKNSNIFLIAFFSMIFSLVVEMLQMRLKVGIFDVDDILMNTCGGVLGYLFYAFCEAVFFHRDKGNRKKRRK